MAENIGVPGSLVTINARTNTKVTETVEDIGSEHNVHIITIRLYDTDIMQVRYAEGRTVMGVYFPCVGHTRTVTLNAGGYRTPTTKRRINEAAKALGLVLRVVQKDYQWYVTQSRYGLCLFEDNATWVDDSVSGKVIRLT